MELTFRLAVDADAPALAALHSEVADYLTRAFGHGHWSSSASEQSVRRVITNSRVIVARGAEGITGTLRLATKKPWAIDVAFFKPDGKCGFNEAGRAEYRRVPLIYFERML